MNALLLDLGCRSIHAYEKHWEAGENPEDINRSLLYRQVNLPHSIMASEHSLFIYRLGWSLLILSLETMCEDAEGASTAKPVRHG